MSARVKHYRRIQRSRIPGWRPTAEALSAEGDAPEGPGKGIGIKKCILCPDDRFACPLEPLCYADSGAVPAGEITTDMAGYRDRSVGPARSAAISQNAVSGDPRGKKGDQAAKVDCRLREWARRSKIDSFVGRTEQNCGGDSYMAEYSVQ